MTITLAEPVSLSGRVLDSDGVGVPDQQVSISPLGTSNSIVSQTDADGYYELLVSPGEYVVELVNRASPGGGVHVADNYYLTSYPEVLVLAESMVSPRHQTLLSSTPSGLAKYSTRF